MTGHQCHALTCSTAVRPAMLMCGRHWRMVPGPLRRWLWANYRSGQESDKQPSAGWLRSAAACVEAVARTECIDEDAIALEVGLYMAWADRIDSGSA